MESSLIKKCKYEHCNHQIFLDEIDDYCVFHSKNIKEKKELFEKEFTILVNDQRESNDYWDMYYFNGFIFPEEFTFTPFFQNKKIDKDIYLDNSRFCGAVDLSNYTFEKAASFSFCKFKSNTNFSGSKFSGDTNFYDSKFFKNVTFDSSEFFKELNFQSTDFIQTVSFFQTIFHGDTDFVETKFHENSSFSESRFKDVVYFTFAEFIKHADFTKARFYEYTEFGLVKFYLCADFSNTYFFNTAQFAGMVSHLELIKLNNTYFYDVDGLLEEIITGIKKKIIKPYCIKLPKPIKQIVMTFNKASIRITEFITKEINPILGEKASQKYPILARQIKDDNYLLNFRETHKNWFFWWWLLSDFGRSFLRWAVWGAMIIVLFAFILSQPPDIFGGYLKNCFFNHGPVITQEIKAVKVQISDFWSMLYVSLITFTSFGFDSAFVAQNAIAKVFICLEIIFGYLMLGGLISIFTNKLSRRS